MDGITSPVLQGGVVDQSLPQRSDRVFERGRTFINEDIRFLDRWLEKRSKSEDKSQ